MKRVPNEKYEAVQKEMQEKKVVAELTELAGFVRAESRAEIRGPRAAVGRAARRMGDDAAERMQVARAAVRARWIPTSWS